MSVQSIERAFAILGVVAVEPVGLSEVARRVDLPKSTVARLMATLEALGVVERIEDTYVVGPHVKHLAAAVTGTSHLISLVRPRLEELVAATGEAAGMGVPEGDQVLYVIQLDSDNPVNVRDWTGTLAPMHTTPSGITMLAGWSDDALERYLSADLAKNTPSTLTEPAAIRSRVAAARRDGYAWGRDEFYEGITSVASPVVDAAGIVVAALDVFGPSYRFPGASNAAELGKRVRRSADAVADALR